MSFVKLLQGIGDKLGILETAPAAGVRERARIQTRIVSLRDLTTEIKSGAVQSLADAPEELAVSFEEIFRAAGVSANPQDWTADRLKRVIESEDLRGKPREEVQKAILALLKSEGVAAEVVVKDAMARDQALDAYETAAGEKLQARLEAFRKRRSTAESRIRELQKECASLEQSMKNEAAKWDEWKRRKLTRERELASIVSYIIDHTVITTED